MPSRKTICLNCDMPIQRTHRFKVVHHKFLWWRWETRVHRNCMFPDLHVSPFPGLRVEQRKMNSHLEETLFQHKPIPGRQYCDLFGPSVEELERQVYENGMEK